jgi:hypothetical protein
LPLLADLDDRGVERQIDADFLRAEIGDRVFGAQAAGDLRCDGGELEGQSLVEDPEIVETSPIADTTAMAMPIITGIASTPFLNERKRALKVSTNARDGSTTITSIKAVAALLQ